MKKHIQNKVANTLGDDYLVFNFGLSGWRPHQALALMEGGCLEELAQKYDELHVFYMALPDHGERASGSVVWDQNGPYFQPQLTAA